MRPAVYWLTKIGARDCSEYLTEGAEARARKKPYIGGSQARQRIEIVDCCIALYQWAERSGWAVDWVRTEFSRKKGKLEPSTKLAWSGGSYLPDGLACVTAPSGAQFLFALEVETGGEVHSVDNFGKHLDERMNVLREFGIEQALGWPSDNLAARLLFVFSTPAMLEEAKHMIGQPDADEWQSVGFKALPAVVQDFGSPWWQVRGERSFPFSRL